MGQRIVLIAIILVNLFSLATLKAEDMPSHRIFTKDGKATNFSSLLDASLKSEIIFFGELHNNPICHWLRLQLVKAIYSKIGKKLIIGAEMFEADDQLKIDEYFSGLINQTNFEKEVKLWNNYKTDYKPLLEFAKDSGLKFIATNIPRRYASSVSRKGFAILDSVAPEGKRFIAPLPIDVDLELPGYKKIREEMKGSHSSDYIAEAQAVKDATMAYFISRNYEKGKLFLHLNGSYHTNNFEGIVWFIARNNPKFKMLTIATVEQVDINYLDDKNLNIADFILVIPLDMTKTY